MTDIQNEAGEYLSEEVLEEFVAEHYLMPADKFNKKLMELTKSFIGTGIYPDDFTVLTSKFLKC